MLRIIRLFALSIATVAAIWYASARRRAELARRPLGDVLRHDLTSFVTRRFDPVVMRLGLAGGRVSPWGVLEHVGRATGAVHRTPVTPHLVDDHVFIPLPYGTDVQWVQNVLVGGHCRVQLHETIYDLDEPRIVMASENPSLPPIAHEALDETPAHYLRLHVLDRAPGTFANPPHEFSTHAAPSAVPTLAMEHPVVEAPSEGAPA